MRKRKLLFAGIACVVIVIIAGSVILFLATKENLWKQYLSLSKEIGKNYIESNEPQRKKNEEKMKAFMDSLSIDEIVTLARQGCAAARRRTDIEKRLIEASATSNVREVLARYSGKFTKDTGARRRLFDMFRH